MKNTKRIMAVLLTTVLLGIAISTGFISAAEPLTEYIVRYYPNGGSGDMADQTAIYDEYITLTGNTFTRPGFVFIGWNTETDGSGSNYNDRQAFTPWKLTSDLHLYAKWMSLSQILWATIPDAPEFPDPIVIEYPPEALLDNVQLNVDLVRDEKWYDVAGFEYATPVFDINLTLNGIPVQPNAKVVVRIPDPFEADVLNPVIYRVSDDGVTKIDMYAVRVIYDGKRYLEFVSDHFSYYALANGPISTPSISLNKGSLPLTYKGSERLISTVSGSSSPVRWTSSNTSLVTVDQNGNVQSAKNFWKTGSAVITAKCESVTATCSVSVSPSFWQWLLIIFLFGWIWM